MTSAHNDPGGEARPALIAEYVRRPLPVRAVQWTRGNGPAVTELLRTVEPFWFARDNPHGGWQCVVDHHYQRFGTVRQVWLDDWLVITPENGIAWLSPQQFEALYEPAGALLIDGCGSADDA